MQNFISKFFHFIIKLVLAAFGLVFAISFLFVVLVVMVFSLLKSLITWTKPTPFVIFRQFRQFRQFRKNSRAGWPRASKPMPQSDVVDVEVREVKDPANEQRLP